MTNLQKLSFRPSAGQEAKMRKALASNTNVTLQIRPEDLASGGFHVLVPPSVLKRVGSAAKEGRGSRVTIVQVRKRIALSGEGLAGAFWGASKGTLKRVAKDIMKGDFRSEEDKVRENLKKFDWDAWNKRKGKGFVDDAKASIKEASKEAMKDVVKNVGKAGAAWASKQITKKLFGTGAGGALIYDERALKNALHHHDKNDERLGRGIGELFKGVGSIVDALKVSRFLVDLPAGALKQVLKIFGKSGRGNGVKSGGVIGTFGLTWRENQQLREIVKHVEALKKEAQKRGQGFLMADSFVDKGRTGTGIDPISIAMTVTNALLQNKFKKWSDMPQGVPVNPRYAAAYRRAVKKYGLKKGRGKKN